MGRVENATRNIVYGYIDNIISLLLKFLSRTVFIYALGTTYLGVNGLFTNILSVLSLAELGIGIAINFSLYKPVAEKDVEKIKSIMWYYKKAYRIIALVVTIIGLLLLPFLKYFIREPGNLGISELITYYLVFLFNTVSTYFVAYKYSLINAEQKNYIQTNIRAITTLIVTVLQIIMLILYKNFLIYLLTAAFIELVQKVFVNSYLNKRYPYLLSNNIKRLSKEETVLIRKNIKALIYHKIGSISRHQTDNIIVSSFINISTVGVISNYVLIVNSVNKFINTIFNSVISGFGNLIATENTGKQYNIFKVYRFVAFWIYGFSAIAFFTLLSSFITLWLGKEMTIDNITVFYISIDFYFMGHRVIINNLKTAAGIFNADKYIAIIMAIVNLVLSVILVRNLGLRGVYIGTLCSGLISNLTKPYIVYRKMFQKNVVDYYIESIKYLLAIAMAFLFIEINKLFFIKSISIKSFLFMVVCVIIIPNTVFYLFFRKSYEYSYLKGLIKKKFARSIKK